MHKRWASVSKYESRVEAKFQKSRAEFRLLAPWIWGFSCVYVSSTNNFPTHAALYALICKMVAWIKGKQKLLAQSWTCDKQKSTMEIPKCIKMLLIVRDSLWTLMLHLWASLLSVRFLESTCSTLSHTEVARGTTERNALWFVIPATA